MWLKKLMSHNFQYHYYWYHDLQTRPYVYGVCQVEQREIGGWIGSVRYDALVIWMLFIVASNKCDNLWARDMRSDSFIEQKRHGVQGPSPSVTEKTPADCHVISGVCQFLNKQCNRGTLESGDFDCEKSCEWFNHLTSNLSTLGWILDLSLQFLYLY